MYKITLLPNAEKSFKKFDKSVQLKIAEKIEYHYGGGYNGLIQALYNIAI